MNKLEAGTQVTSLTLVRPDGFGDSTELGFGGRITYNFNRNVAVEAEINFFPHKNVFHGLGEGRALQAQFGVKAGKRFEKFGVFGKVRPRGRVLFEEPLVLPYEFWSAIGKLGGKNGARAILNRRVTDEKAYPHRSVVDRHFPGRGERRLRPT